MGLLGCALAWQKAAARSGWVGSGDGFRGGFRPPGAKLGAKLSRHGTAAHEPRCVAHGRWVCDTNPPAWRTGKPTITAKKPFPVKHLHRQTVLCGGLDADRETVDNHASAGYRQLESAA